MIDGFFIDELHHVYNVSVIGASLDTNLGWYDIDRGSYIETVVTHKDNLFLDEEAAKKESFLRLLKDKG